MLFFFLYSSDERFILYDNSKNTIYNQPIVKEIFTRISFRSSDCYYCRVTLDFVFCLFHTYRAGDHNKKQKKKKTWGKKEAEEKEEQLANRQTKKVNR